MEGKKQIFKKEKRLKRRREKIREERGINRPLKEGYFIVEKMMI